MPHADAEERRAPRQRRSYGGIDARVGQPAHGGRKAAHARQHELLRARDGQRVGRHRERRARGTQRAGDVRRVRHRRVDQSDLHQITPFVLGIALPVTSFAIRTATANALKIASAAWCPLRPRSRSTWMLHAHLFAHDLKNSSTSANGKSLWMSSISRSMGASKTRYGRPAKSTTTRASASSSGTYAWPKRRMPRLWPRALAQG